MTATPPLGDPWKGVPPGGSYVSRYDHQPWPQPPVLPKSAYTPWSRRLRASLIDWIPMVMFVGGPAVYWVVQRFSCDDFRYDVGPTTRSYEYYCTSTSGDVQGALTVCGLLMAIGYFLWNMCYRQGKTGRSIGKSAMRFRCVRDTTWDTIGFWRSLGRQTAHYLDYTFFLVGFLLPLWDQKRQTFADKIVGTVCLPDDRTPASADLGPVAVASPRRVDVASWVAAGVVVLFMGACGAALVTGSSASSSIRTTAREGAIGDPVSDGDLQFVVVSVGKGSLPDDPVKEGAVVLVVITNTGERPHRVTVSDQDVIDTTGRAYPAAGMAIFPDPQGHSTTMVDVTPGTIRLVIRFEVPRRTRLEAIELHDAPSSVGATIGVH